MPEPPGASPPVELYDTTLRDGAQRADLSYTIEDRLRILHRLDDLGFPYVEGGWPGANPRDSEFFRLASKEALRTAALPLFGMTRRAGEAAGRGTVLADLLEAGTETVCLVGKAWDLHVTDALRASPLEEGLRMIGESVAHLVRRGRRVFFDAEHFFDGYRANPAYALGLPAGGRGGGRRAAGAVRHDRRGPSRRCGPRRAGGWGQDRRAAGRALP